LNASKILPCFLISKQAGKSP